VTAITFWSFLGATLFDEGPCVAPDRRRHTFKRRAARAGIETGLRDTICGHSPRAVGDRYETPTVADMAEALKKFSRYEIE
jgi:hypothetical protein